MEKLTRYGLRISILLGVFIFIDKISVLVNGASDPSISFWISFLFQELLIIILVLTFVKYKDI